MALLLALAPDPLQRPQDYYRFSFEIEIGPLQAEQLSLSWPKAQGKPEQGFQSISRNRLQENAGLRFIVNM
jgi:hypothetical protein